MAEISRIRPFLWFDGQAQEAMEYLSLIHI